MALISKIFLACFGWRTCFSAPVDFPSFQEYVEQYSSYYPDGLSNRRTEYDAAVESIKKHNADPLVSWKVGVNQFTVMSEQEKGKYYGYMKRTGTSFMQPMAMGVPFPGPRVAKPMPVGMELNVDWRKHEPSVVTSVKNQGACGSCWAFSATETMESAIALDTGVLFDLSPQQLTSCTPNPQECGGSGGCMGATAQLAFEYTMKSGITEEWTWAYESGVESTNGNCYENSRRNRPVAGIKSFQQLPANDAHSLLEAVQQSPVSVSVAASDWGSYHSGIFAGCDMQNPVINHAVVLMGYGEEAGKFYWLIRNSWGPTWGELGYIRLQRHPEGEPCGLDTEPLDGFSCKTNPPGSIVACGMCGVLADSSYPTGGYLGEPKLPEDPALDNKTRTSKKKGATKVGVAEDKFQAKQTKIKELQDKFLANDISEDTAITDKRSAKHFGFSWMFALPAVGAMSVFPLRWFCSRPARNYAEVLPAEA